MTIASPPVVVVRPHTAGQWTNRDVAKEVSGRWIPPTAPSTPTFFVLDLDGTSPSSDVLEELLQQIRQRIKAGGREFATLGVSTPNASLRHLIEWLLAREDLPISLSATADPRRLAPAMPAGVLTATESETLEAVVSMGGRVSAADVARRLNLNGTAASNRLVNLAARGYLKRQSRPGREGDLFADPRLRSPAAAVATALSEAREGLDPGELARTERLLQRALEGGTEGVGEPTGRTGNAPG